MNDVDFLSLDVLDFICVCPCFKTESHCVVLAGLEITDIHLPLQSNLELKTLDHLKFK